MHCVNVVRVQFLFTNVKDLYYAKMSTPKGKDKKGAKTAGKKGNTGGSGKSKKAGLTFPVTRTAGLFKKAGIHLVLGRVPVFMLLLCLNTSVPKCLNWLGMPPETTRKIELPLGFLRLRSATTRSLINC